MFMGFDLSVSISVLTVFLQGLLSFFSPCVLPLIPLYIGYLSGGTGQRDEEGNWRYSRKRVLVNTLFFICGISFAFFVLGLGVSAAGSFLKSYQGLIARAGGVLVILLGLYQMGIFGKSKVLGQEHRLPLHLDRMAMSPVTALIMGFSFSFAWTPCVGPALSSVLLMTASTETSLQGFLLIGVYTLGFVLPFLAAGMFTTTILGFFRKHVNVVRYTVKIGALLLVFMGLMMLTGYGNAVFGALSSGTETNAEKEEQEDSEPENRKEDEEQNTDTDTDTETVDFTLYDQYGTAHSLEEYRGKVVFLNFWATWCSPCRMEMPDIQKLYENYQSQGDEGEVVVLGVAAPGIGGEGTKEEVAAFMSENGYTYPVLMDETGEISQRFGISAYPTTYMIDRQGRVYGYVSGMLSYENMEEIIRQTLEGKSS